MIFFGILCLSYEFEKKYAILYKPLKKGQIRGFRLRLMKIIFRIDFFFFNRKLRS